MILKPQKMRFDEWAIRAELKRRGFTFAKMAEESGFSASSLRGALVKPSSKVNAFIASKLNQPLNELWPDWFDHDGDLIPTKIRQKLNRLRRESASQNNIAA
jgi:lambda repressor-like predicted transcriptional regulator